MALPANTPANPLQRLPPELVSTLRLSGVSAGRVLSQDAVGRPVPLADIASPALHLPTGLAAIDRALPDGGLPKGVVVELSVRGAASLGTSLGLCACASAQQSAERLGGVVPWCAFIDPSQSLYAPGVARLGVRLERLLVVRPSLEALTRVALKVTESQCFAVVVIDTVGVPGAELCVPLGGWPRVVRRLALTLQETQNTVVLITDSAAKRSVPLPVAQRIELARIQSHKLILQVVKDRRGRITPPHAVDLEQGQVIPAERLVNHVG